MDVTIVVPVFQAADRLAALLDSLSECCPGEQALLFIDDGSQCEEIDRYLTDFCLRSSTRVWVKEKQNRGFVGTANLGMSIARGHVLLLNSDTIVTPGWLERMVRCLESDTRIGTVTPWSNNAEICSIPRFVENNPVPPDPAKVAGVISSTGLPMYPTLPTAVGFCMLIRKSLIDKIGGFDEDTFGRGYGEENDFCKRAESAGFRNVLCDDAYVVHVGGASFSTTGLKPGPETMERLLRKHPEYQGEIADFIQRDPFGKRRDILVSALQEQQVI